MSLPAPAPSLEAAPAPSQDVAALNARLRATLVRRLQDIVGMPGSRLTPHERQIAGDLLLETLGDCDEPTRVRCAERLAGLAEAPKPVLRRLAIDTPAVARPLLEGCAAFDDSDLIAAVRQAGPAHRALIAQRKHVHEAVADEIIAFEEPEVIQTLLRNEAASVSIPALDRVVRLSRDHAGLVGALLRRLEVTPAQAYTMFWWADAEQRVRILKRFAAERIVLQDSLADLFAVAVRTNWSDPMVRKTLQFVERRQRNRAAVERSPYETLEAAVDALRDGVTALKLREIGYMCGLKPAVAAQILGDIGGEAIAVLCKAVALKRPAIETIWRTVRRARDPLESDPSFIGALRLYDSLSTNKAQTVVRYWNWSLSSAMSAAQARSAAVDDADEVARTSAAGWSASLVFGQAAPKP